MVRIRSSTSKGPSVGTGVSTGPTARPTATTVSAGDTSKVQIGGLASNRLLGFAPSSFATGAAKILSDGIVFPHGLLDPNDPKNDPKYLRMLAAVLGLDELEHFCEVLEERQREEARNRQIKEREEESRGGSGQSEQEEEEDEE